jgi:FMN-dependent NADH-azoreductase
MTQTLVVGYAPRHGSYTKILIEEFLNLAEGKTKINYVDLVQSPPDLLLEENLNLIMQWNQGKRDFFKAELYTLSNHNKLIADVIEADNIVLGFPIYNFTMPAAVKAWVDAIVVSDKTFSFDPASGFKGLCNDKKALSIMVSGFDYRNSNDVKEYASSTIKQNFDFIGITSEQITAYGVDQNRDQLDLIIGKAKLEIKQVIDSWFPG